MLPLEGPTSVSDGISTDGYSTGVVVTDAGKRLGSAGTYPSSYVTEVSFMAYSDFFSRSFGRNNQVFINTAFVLN